MAPSIRISPTGRLGNHIFQYMFARVLQMQVPGSLITGYSLPDFRIAPLSSLPTAAPQRTWTLRGHVVNLQKAAYTLRSGIVNEIEIAGYFQRMEYYSEHRAILSSLFNGGADIASGYGENHLLINIRSEDIMTGGHVDYTPLPFAFYRALIESTQLNPVFMGQIDNSRYVRELRGAFPEATFVPTRGSLVDFETIRRSRNIVPAVSSFSWLAAWFSEADRIFFPVSGIYNPQQRPDVDLLPIADRRYAFYVFPVRKWQATEADFLNLFSGERTFHETTAAELSQLYPI